VSAGLFVDSLIRVAVVEDNDGYRRKVVDLLRTAPGFRCVGDYGSVGDALEGSELNPPDLVVMDIELPDVLGIVGVREFRRRFPRLLVMMLSGHEDAGSIFESLQAGASGYLVKGGSSSELLSALMELARGGSPMSTQIARLVVASFHRSPAVPEAALSERENEILHLLAKGYRNKEIADQLSIAVETVKSHTRHIYEKLQVQSRTEAVAKHLRASGSTAR
jgi:DNA-binding NarL/FixJ family response regulator